LGRPFGHLFTLRIHVVTAGIRYPQCATKIPQTPDDLQRFLPAFLLLPNFIASSPLRRELPYFFFFLSSLLKRRQLPFVFCLGPEPPCIFERNNHQIEKLFFLSFFVREGRDAPGMAWIGWTDCCGGSGSPVRRPRFPPRPVGWKKRGDGTLYPVYPGNMKRVYFGPDCSVCTLPEEGEKGAGGN